MSIHRDLSGIVLILCFMGIFNACNPGAKTETLPDVDSISLEDIHPLVHDMDSAGMGLPIFYNMYLSVEMSSLFRSSGAMFRPELLNAPEKMAQYGTSAKKAMNLGVYAVDLTYAKVCEQPETAGKYFNAMQMMAEELGIPPDYFKNSAERFDRNIDNKDSLIKIANEVYMTSDNYLRENERFAASAQIILGGWVEAIYIATHIALATQDIEIIERLAEQRFSLNHVVSMLNAYANDMDIKQNLQYLKELQVVFDHFVVEPDADFDPDKPQGKRKMQEYMSAIQTISTHIRNIRKGIVT